MIAFIITPARKHEIEKLTKKFLNEHQQQQVRQEAMEDLLQIDHPKAVVGLIKRLGVNFRDTIKNEQEKNHHFRNRIKSLRRPDIRHCRAPNRGSHP